eukprot:232184-Pyramimonas_sp.AAC.1
MRTDEGLRLALNDIKMFKGKHITLWGSMPCTGGSLWQYVNEAHYFRTGSHSAMRRLRVARAVHKAGGVVCIEWPTQCKYWRDPQVKDFMRELEFVKTVLHGRAYGLKDSKGNFMKKPWTIASTSSGVAEGLERKCDGAHEHVEARG